MPEFAQFPSRRSVVHSTAGIVSCTQPLAAQAGLEILRQGGNAADAAVAVAAALNVTEPHSTGIGGDMFCLFYDAQTKKVLSLNGSSRSGANVTHETVTASLRLANEKDTKEPTVIPTTSVHAVTVPGAAAGWVDVVERFGNRVLSLEQILAPAIDMCEKGFPVHEVASYYWTACEQRIKDASPNGAELLKNGESAPKTGEIMTLPTLAATFRELAKHGKKGFYEGRVAEEIVKVVRDLGGYLTLDDLKRHGAEERSQDSQPIALEFKGQNVGTSGSSSSTGIKIWEHPPNGQGIVALMALGILEELERTKQIPAFAPEQHNSPEYIHAIVECLRLAFADACWWVSDPDVVKVPTAELLSKPYLASRAALFHPQRVADVPVHGNPSFNTCDTVYFAVTDRWGNGISFINSVYLDFGSAIVPRGCGFALQNRGCGFSLDPGHPNVLAPNKRPYHTIIPAMLTDPKDDSLHTIFGVMGAFMQPQGHVQVFLNMLAFNFNPQAALDAPRICIGPGLPDKDGVVDMTVFLEEGISEETAKTLQALGHKVQMVKGHGRALFGKGQVIRCHTKEGRLVYAAGSDPRGDGAAVPAYN